MQAWVQQPSTIVEPTSAQDFRLVAISPSSEEAALSRCLRTSLCDVGSCASLSSVRGGGLSLRSRVNRWHRRWQCRSDQSVDMLANKPPEQVVASVRLADRFTACVPTRRRRDPRHRVRVFEEFEKLWLSTTVNPNIKPNPQPYVRLTGDLRKNGRPERATSQHVAGQCDIARSGSVFWNPQECMWIRVGITHFIIRKVLFRLGPTWTDTR